MNLRKIDHLIATKVLGWEYHEAIYTWGELFSLAKYVTKDGREILTHDLPHFSTNLLDAWKVVEKLKIAVIPQIGNPPKNMQYLAEIDKRPLGGYYEAFAETAPLAICLVALKSVGIEVNEL